MAQRYKFSIESKSFPLDISGEPLLWLKQYDYKTINPKNWCSWDLYVSCDGIFVD